MTNLEAVESIVVDLTPTAKEHNKDEIEQIKKSLEIYEIFCKIRKYEDLTDEELHKMIGWIENGKTN